MKVLLFFSLIIFHACEFQFLPNSGKSNQKVKFIELTSGNNPIIPTDPNVLRIVSPVENQAVSGPFQAVFFCSGVSRIHILVNSQLQQDFSCNGVTQTTSLTPPSSEGPFDVQFQSLSASNSVVDIVAINMHKDTTPPVLGIRTPVENFAHFWGINLTGICESSGVNPQVIVAGDGVMNPPVLIPCLNNAFSGSVEFSAGIGVKNVLVRQVDSARNLSEVTRQFQKVAPPTVATVSILTPVENRAFNQSFSVSGTCSEVTSLRYRVQNSANMPATCSGGQFQFPVNLPSAEGNFTVVVEGLNSAGTVAASASRVFVKDTIPPNVTIISPPPNSSHQGSVTIQGTCEGNQPLSVSGTGLILTNPYPCSNGNFNFNMMFTAQYGPRPFQISQTDLAGNSRIVNYSVNYSFPNTEQGRFLAAKQVLQQHCLSCHGQGGQSTLLDYSSDEAYQQLGWVVAQNIASSPLINRIFYFNGVNSNMPYLPNSNQTNTAFPSSAYQTLVNWVSNMSVSTGGGGGPGAGPSRYQKMLLADNHLMRDKMKVLFGLGSIQAHFDLINQIKNKHHFAGNCDPATTLTNDICTGDHSDYSYRPDNTVLRAASHVNACEVILRAGNNHYNPLTYFWQQIQPGQIFVAPTSNTISLAYQKFFPHQAIPPSLIQKLMEVSASAGGNASDQWRAVLFTLCIMPEWGHL